MGCGGGGAGKTQRCFATRGQDVLTVRDTDDFGGKMVHPKRQSRGWSLGQIGARAGQGAAPFEVLKERRICKVIADVTSGGLRLAAKAELGQDFNTTNDL